MNGWRMLGVLFGAGIFIKLVADGVMPRLLMQAAQFGGTLSRGTRSTFRSF